MLDFLLQWDVKLFHFINQTLDNSYLTAFMVFITNLHNNPVVTRFILPVLLIFWFYRKKKEAVKIFLSLALLAGLCDFASYRFLKSSFKRLRPNNEISLNAQLKLPHNPQSYSMPSNHAVTGFALAFLLHNIYPHLKILWWSLVVIVGASRVYVGVHYPSDILIGGLIGVIISTIFFLILRRIKFFEVLFKKNKIN